MKVVAVLLMLCGSVLAQSREDLTKKYGAPRSETFLLRSNIAATVSYGSNGQITELVIAPFTNALIKSFGNGVSPDALKELIDELLPESTRGGVLATCLPANDCNGSQMSYEKLTIYYNAGKNGNVNYAVVQWRQRSLISPSANKSLDANGGSVVRIMTASAIRS
jgi:hypothetical protein